MKNVIKTGLYTAVAGGSIALTNVFASTTATQSVAVGAARGGGDLNQNASTLLNQQRAKDLALSGQAGGGIGETIINIMKYLLGFMALIAIIFCIYAGFQILTAGGDDEKVKKGKTTLINALLGIFVIWISWTLVNWVLGGLGSVQ